MTQVFGSSIVPGAQVFGAGSLGVPGALIPGTGDAGPAYAYPSLEHPGDDAAEIQGLVTAHTFPPGTFFAYGNTSFTVIGAPDGAYSVTFDLKRDGLRIGAVTFRTYIGAVAAVAMSMDDAVFGGFAYEVSVDELYPLKGKRQTYPLTGQVPH